MQENTLEVLRISPREAKAKLDAGARIVNVREYPEAVRFPDAAAIDSVSLHPDTVLKTTLDVLEIEKELPQSHQSTRGLRVLE